jgi:integrase
MLCRVTHKRPKRVWIPLHPELLFALEAACAERRSQPLDHVLLNPETGGPMSRPRLYERIKALGERSGVNGAHPHRFRDMLAVDMLLKGASPYNVAKTLGDTIAVVEEHYAPYAKELRERTRRILESPDRIEKPGRGLHDFCTPTRNERESAMKLKEIVAGEPISRILKTVRQIQNLF